MTDRIGVSKSGPATSFWLEGDLVGQDIAGNFSRFHFYLRAANGPGGTTGSQFNNAGAQIGLIDGWGEFGRHSGHPFLPAGYQNGQQRWRDGPWQVDIGHDGNGYHGGFNVRMALRYGNINEDYVAWMGGFPRIPKRPSPPNTPSVSEVTATSMRLSWNLPDNQGAGLDQMLLRRWDNAAGTGNYTNYINGGGTTSLVVTGLNPGTTYSWRVYAHNTVGYSDQSGLRVQATLPSTPPLVSVLPALSGMSATVTLSPPGGVSGVTKYIIEYGLVGATTFTTVETTTTTRAITGLTPGRTYQYRAKAVIGGYTSPVSEWLPVVQPNPNTSPGEFFAGNTANTSDIEYVWTGTPGKSTSEARGRSPRGWVTTYPNSEIFRVTGGFAGAFSARVIFLADQTGPGTGHAGQDRIGIHRTEVEGDTRYQLSIHARPSRAQRLAAIAFWMNAAGDVIGSPSYGTDVAAPANAWTRLIVDEIAPSEAAYVAVRVTDVAGTGHSPWLSGESMLIDASMASLGNEVYPWFSGDTPDTPEFRYDWVGAANQSISTRTTLQEGEVDLLIDPDCPPPPAPPQPPVIPSDCIEEVGTWRRYMVQIEESDVPLWGATLPTLILTTDVSAERQVRIRFYPNPEAIAPELVDYTRYDAELILTYIPPRASITLDGVAQRVWATVRDSDPVSADQLLYGTGGVPATWPELVCGMGYIITLEVPLDAPAGNLSTRVMLTNRV